MSRRRGTLTYADAVKVLQAPGGEWVDVLDKALGGAVLAASAIGSPALLSLLGPKNELVKVSREGLTAAVAKAGNASRVVRTQRIEAAHAILVTSSYVDEVVSVVAEIGRDLRVPESDILSALVLPAGGEEDPGRRSREFVASLVNRGLPSPSAGVTREGLRESIVQHYRDLGPVLARLFRNLQLWDALNETQQSHLLSSLTSTVPAAALARYEADYRRLAGDVPEFYIWGDLADTDTTQWLVRQSTLELEAGLHELKAGTQAARDDLSALRELLASATAGRSVPAGVRTQLAGRYESDVARPILDTSDQSVADLTPPTAAVAYVNPSFKVAVHQEANRPASEDWWLPLPRRDDLQTFLAAHLTTSACWEVPMIVLGHPGAGKSLLTRVLAAQLPSSSFVPVRVVLRSVSASRTVAKQVEEALQRTLNEDVPWATLRAAASDGAVPVVLLDGFDELLQASGVSKSNYLEQVQEFQQVEAELGSPVAVIVTSRTVVADRARIPIGSTIVKLEPFSHEQVGTWIQRWNTANAASFANRAVAPLRPATVLAQRELAQQPILLLMLAIYDAADNALARETAELRRGALYERLLQKFIEREVHREQPHQESGPLSRSVALEFRRLEIVALAMFNRGRQNVSELELDSDFDATGLTASSGSVAAFDQDFNRQLSVAQSMPGRFFFVHKAEVSDSADISVRSHVSLGSVAGSRVFEFLHATFGEFLVARAALKRVTTAHEHAVVDQLGYGPSNRADEALRMLFSHQPLSNSAQIISFLEESVAGGLPPDKKDSLGDFLLDVLHQTMQSGGRGLESRYDPATSPLTARVAAYSANLLVLHATLVGPAVLTGDEGSELWRRASLLWRSQLTEEAWNALVETLHVQRLPNKGANRSPLLVQIGGTKMWRRQDLAQLAIIGWDYETRSHLTVRQGRVRSEATNNCFLAGGVSQGTAADLLIVPGLLEAFDVAVLGRGPVNADAEPVGTLAEILLAIAVEGASLAAITVSDLYAAASSLIGILYAAGTGVGPGSGTGLPLLNILLRFAVRDAERLNSESLENLASAALQLLVDSGENDQSVLISAVLISSAVLARGHQRSAATATLDRALGLLDLPHILDQPEAAVRVYSAVDRSSLGTAAAIPEYGEPREFVDRLDLVVLADVSSELPEMLLDVARRSDCRQWASTAGILQAAVMQQDALERVSSRNMLFLIGATLDEKGADPEARKLIASLYREWALWSASKQTLEEFLESGFRDD